MNDNNLLKQQLQKQEKLSALGLMCAGIVHEIQNPLNFVINFSKLSASLLDDLSSLLGECEGSMTDDMKDEAADIMDSLKQNLAIISDNGQRATDIVQSILMLSRGKEDEYVRADVCKIVKEYVWLAYHAMRANHSEFNVTIHEHYDDNVPLAEVVPQEISRAVINLMNNACYAVWSKAKEHADYSPEINVTVSATDGLLSVSIADNGVGMSQEVQRQLYDEFFTTKPIGEGTGLGMGITRRIIEDKHHGTLSFSSVLGEGSTFYFSIPLNP